MIPLTAAEVERVLRENGFVHVRAGQASQGSGFAKVLQIFS